MKTIVIQIGNTDNKLTQKQWADFCNEVYESISLLATEIHFSAPSVGWADWQNAALIFTIRDSFIGSLKAHLAYIRKSYLQDSVAWTEGTTEFI